MNSEGKLKPVDDGKNEQSDRKVPGEGEVEEESEGEESVEDNGAEKQVAEGMEAEEGNFINMEVSFAYRTRANKDTFEGRSKDIHLCLSFFLMGGVRKSNLFSTSFMARHANPPLLSLCRSSSPSGSTYAA